MATRLYDKGCRGSHGAKRNRSHASAKMLFERAVDDLDSVLEEAINFYTQFRKDFEQEISGIKSYANSDILSSLWISKAKKNETSRPAGHRERTPAAQFGKEEKKHGFGPKAKQICRSFELAITAANDLLAHRPNYDGKFDLQSTAWILKKLRGAYNDIYTRLEYASKRVDDIDALLTELKMASTFLEADLANRKQGSGRSEPAIQTGVEDGGDDEDGSENFNRGMLLFALYLCIGD